MISFDLPLPEYPRGQRSVSRLARPGKDAAGRSPGESPEILLDPLSEKSSAVLTVKIPLTEHTYYLVENRRKAGSFDIALPDEGILANVL